MMQEKRTKGWTPWQLGLLKGKTYLITGASSGVGLEATRIFLAHGARVVMLNRNAQKSEAVIESLKQEFGQGVNVSFVQMDLAELDSVKKAAAEVRDKVPRIDALICNAAIAQVPKRELTADGFESQFGVNHLAHFLLCSLLFDRIEASGGRIVVVGSLAYRMGLKRIKFEDLSFKKGYTAWDAYAQSKLAQMMFGYELQRLVREAGKHVQVLVCHPGAGRTSLDRSFGLRDRILWGVLKWIVAQPAQRSAWSQVMCATAEGLQPEKLYGPLKRGNTVGPVGENHLDPVALDREAAARLWKVSEELTGTRFECSLYAKT